MSQRPPASRHASRSPPDVKRIILPPVPSRDDAQQAGRDGRRPQADNESRGVPLPQLSRIGQTSPTVETWRAAPTRDLGVRSMLNPTEPEVNIPSGRRLSGSLESPSSTVGALSQFAPSPTLGPTHTFPPHQLVSATPSVTEGYGGILPRGRKILTPRSPSRTLSSAGRGRAGTIDAHLSPFLSSRGANFTSELGQPFEVPLMPTPPGQAQLHREYPFPAPASTPVVGRRTSTSTMQAPAHAPPSQSASPSISASSHNPSSSQTSPAAFPYSKGSQAPPTLATPYFPGSSFGNSLQQGQMGGLQYQGTPAAPEGPYSQAPPQTQGGSSLQSSSAGSSRQTSASDPIQVLTISTPQGQFTVPVDVHQASRSADEKRARNAGASARFRQRRKEKEQEANSNIEKLQQQMRELERKVRDVEQERDFYRGERNRYRDVLYRTPELSHLARQAPSSPGAMRATSFQRPGPHQQIGGPSPQMGYQPSPTTTLERAPRRRRTGAHGDFANVPYATPATLPPVQSPSFAQGPPSLPPLRIENNPPRTASSMAPLVRTPLTEAPGPSYAPYSRSPYERGWPGDGPTR